MNEPLYGIFGAAGCGRGIMPLARQQLTGVGIGPERLVFVDDAPRSSFVNGHRVMTYAEFLGQPASHRFIAVAIANGLVRKTIVSRCHTDMLLPWSITAESVVIMDDVQIGEGAILSPFVTLTSNIAVGKYFQANLYSYVEHDSIVGDFVTFAPGVKCNGNVRIGDHAYIGAGAIIRQGRPGKPLVIGEGAVIGMGAVITRDVPPGMTVVGNPARVLNSSGSAKC